jgi:hypothetical protein
MKLATFCVVLTMLALVVHLVWWRFRVPRKQMPLLLVVFLGALPLAGILRALLPAIREVTPASLQEWVYVAVVYIPVSLAYIATYSAVEEDSPSLRIVRYVADAGSAGRSRDDLSHILNDEVLLGSRLQAMVRDGLVLERDGTYALTDRGRALARAFTASSIWLGIRAAG